MQTQYKITSETNPSERSITLLLNGKFDEEALPELAQSISEAKDSNQRVLIDLSEVTLVDRKAVRYFSEQTGPNVLLVNCPIYLRSWIMRGPDEIGY